MRLRLLLALFLVGCPPADDDDSVVADDDDAAIDDDDDSALPPCEPPLSITPATIQVLPLDLVVFDGEGGSGDYAWSLASESGGLINDRTGAYLAGELPETTDVVTLEDAACVGSATATVDVLRPLDVEPADLVLPPLTSLTWSVLHGSGEYRCTLAADGSNGSLTEDCQYSAGTRLGLDLIRVEDLVTGEFLLREVAIDPDAVFGHDPDWLAMPAGAEFLLFLTGGTGFVQIESTPPGLVGGSGSRLIGLAPGRAEVVVTDAFTAQSATLTVDVLGDLAVDRIPWSNNYLLPGQARAEDLDGDGWKDLVISHPAASVEGFQGGAVFVYAGGAAGLDPTPVQVFGGPDLDEWGYGLELVDLDGDGQLDLLVGAEENDLAAGNAGAVFVFGGVAGGFFEDEPRDQLLGPRSNIRFGRSIAACDYDGDGLLDLAVGAHDDEDQTALETRNNQGSVYLFRGTVDGFPAVPDQVIWGRTLDGGDWVDHPDQRLGLMADAGDVDGDGRCDLVVGTVTHDGEFHSDQGLVVIFLGTEDGLGPDPWRAITATAAEGASPEIGRGLAVGDADGDGLADVLIGAPNQVVPDAESGNRHGRAHLFFGADLTQLGDGWIDPTEASWTLDGDSGFDETGFWVQFVDLDGDGLDDVLVGSPTDETDEGVNNAGTVQGFLSTAGQGPGLEPAFEVAGDADGDWFGAWATVLDDVDGDGLGEVATYAYRSHTWGLEIGHVAFAPTAGGPVAVLDQPFIAANGDFGAAFAFLPDHDGDGDDELIVGEDEAPLPSEQRGSGRVHVYTDLDAPPAATLQGWAEHDSGDRVGRGVASAGDFDGDGHLDLVVLAHDDHWPGEFDPPEAFANPSECPGGFADRGSLLVFLGDGSGWPAEPSFVAYGPQTNQSLERVVGADVDGDGLGDVVFAGPQWDREGGGDAGGFGVLFGRPHGGGGIEVICDEPWTFVGPSGGDGLGSALAAVGDVTGDGCDEFAVGAWRDDVVANNGGTVRLVHGWGPGCDHGTPRAATFGVDQGSAQLGNGLAGGVDVDADGVPDLAVGADNYSVSGVRAGRAWLLPGATLDDVPAEPLVDGELPETVWPVAPDEGSWHVDGQTAGENLGNGLALVPDLFPPYGGLFVGSPGGARSGVVNTGGGRLHAVGAEGVEPGALLVVGGESWNVGSRLGDEAAAGTIGGVPWIALGSRDCDGSGVDGGCVYALPLVE